MRTVLLILVPMALLAGAFYFVLLRERPAMYVAPTTRPAGPPKISTTALAAADGQTSMIGQSGGVFVESRNKRGRLTNDFRAQRFDPRKDGDVDVVFPEARFYGEGGSLVTLEGSGGRVAVSQPGSRSDPQAMGAASPTSGELKDVTIRFYDSAGDAEPAITAFVPAVHFDAVANRVNTVDSVIDGKGVMAEQVPVTVRGRDFEMDGAGLAMRWNDRDGRLDQLEINHGDRLLVKNAARFGGPTAAPAPTMPKAPAAVANPIAAALMGQVDVAAPPATAPAATRPAARRDLYHATFDRDVRVSRDSVPLAAADVMRVVLPLGDGNATTKPAADAASTRPVVAKARRAGDVRRATASSSGPSASASPATQAGDTIEVRWTGKLTLKPVAAGADAPHEQMVELVGAPAWVSENGSRVDARLIHAEPESGRVRIEAGGVVRSISVRDTNGAELRSRSPLVVDRAAGFAEVSGAGTLTTPAAQGATSPTKAEWSRRLLLDLAGDPTGSLKQITFDGDARIASDQVNVSCGTLVLGFDAPLAAGRAQPRAASGQFSLPAPDVSLLRVVDATGAAKMDAGTGDAARRLAADRIRLGLVATGATAGRPAGAAVNAIRCDGNVALTDAKGLDLSCAVLDAKTKPIELAGQAAGPGTGQTAVPPTPLESIESLLATGDVRLKQADGSRAAGDRVQLDGVPMSGGEASKRLTLIGRPASVASERGSLEGAHITIDPQTGDVDVPGPGKFVGSDAKQPRASMAMAWADSMTTKGATGVCTLNGGVNIDGANADGTRLLATARHGVIEFTTRAVPPTTGPATRPVAPAVANVTFDSIRALHLSDDVDLTMNAAGVRTSSMQTARLDVDLESNTVSAPQAGRMLLIDARRGATTVPTTTPTIANATTLPNNRGERLGPGTLAIAWQDGLLWKLRDGSLTMNAGVRLGFERDGSGDPVRLTCDRLVCGLTPIQSGSGLDQVSQRVELRDVRAEQNVSVRSKLASFDAAALTFDALTNRATATGTPETSVSVYDDQGTAHVGFSAVTWNVETGIIEDFRDIEGRMRR